MSVEKFINSQEEGPASNREFYDFKKKATGIMERLAKLPVLVQLRILDDIEGLRSGGMKDRYELLEKTRSLVDEYKSDRHKSPDMGQKPGKIIEGHDIPGTDNVTSRLMDVFDGIEEKVWSQVKQQKRDFQEYGETHISDKRLPKQDRETIRKQNPVAEL